MLHTLCFLLLFAVQDDHPYDLGDQLRTEGKLFGAESYYLSTEPADEELARVALALSDISLRMGNTETRRNFYQGYLSKSRPWRGVASLILAVLTMDQGDFDAFETNATIYFQEYPGDPLLRLRLAYHLARYTKVKPATLKLTATEQQWFEAVRALEKNRRFPEPDALEGVPPELRWRHYLERESIAELPAETEIQTDADRYIFQVISLRKALLADDFAMAARTINALSPLDRQMRRPDLRLDYYPLLAEFFERRDKSAAAARTRAGRDKLAHWAILPLLLLPERLIEHTPPPEPVVPHETSETTASVPDAVPDAVPDVDTEPTPVAVVKDPKETTRSEAESLELSLRRGQRGLELKIRQLPTDTQYRKIVRNYLLGYHFLKVARLDDALDRLSVAERQVETLPFPILEMKIMLALADYHLAGGQDEKASWYRLQALQIRSADRHLSLFSSDSDAPMPTAALMDVALSQGPGQVRAHQLLYYSETEAAIRLREHAYRRKVLCENPVLGNQLNLIGSQLVDQVEALAGNPNHRANPKRYNNTLSIWSHLWSQTIAEYRATDMPAIKDLQRALGRNDRLISFVEGNRQLGVLLISRDQAFGLPLGDKGSFTSLNADERMGFLAGRLGAVWDQEGRIILSLSDTFRELNLLQALRKKVTDPDRLAFTFSLRHFVSPKQAASCDAGIYFGESAAPAKLDANLAAVVSLDDLDRTDFERYLENYDHVIYEGPMVVSENGLAFGDPQGSLYFHEIVHLNPGLCSLTLIADQPVNWGPVLEELALINPSSALSINLLDGTPTEPLKLGNGQGVRFP